MAGNEIRSMWLEFFKSKGHDVEESASLVPSDDKSLLWMNAGVTPLKKYFDGRKTPKNPRIVNAQKCIRTNDIENVGKTARHHTFFEMLGNFSIGDYFRDDVIPWAVELLTADEWFQIPKDKLYITYYPDDLDTLNKWISCGIDKTHMIPCKGNFWEIGEGPCGPDTEIFYDRGEKYGDFTPKAIEDDIENDRYIEIWNIVFSQFNSDGSGDRLNYKPLPKKNIDTGSGLERLACVFQEAETNYDTDLFIPIIHEVESLSKKEYHGESSFKIIADHLRTITFAISDGALFSNEGRGYVLRRLLRRAVKHGLSLGIKEPFLFKLVDVIVKEMSSYYTGLIPSKELCKKLIKQEEIKFLNTIDSGLEKFNEIIAKSNNKTISGEDAFLLFDTYGFPLELTMEYAEEKGYTVDEKNYLKMMNEQKERARNAKANAQSFAKQNQEYLDFKETSVFTGYESLKEEATIIKVFEEGFVTDKTPFYAISGGQVGDTGTVTLGAKTYAIIDTIMMPNKQHLHIVENPYIFTEGDKVVLVVDEDRREMLMENHSSCHLMFKALRETLGSHVSQQGSEITPEALRFDFNHYESLTDDVILKVESLTNEYINNAYTKKTVEVTIDEARSLGAIAEFGEKYSDLVRVVDLGATIDVCGGTHVKNTKDIKKFMIQSVSSIGSGIFRIVGLTHSMESKEKDYFKGIKENFEKLLRKAYDLENKAKEANVSLKFNYSPKEEYIFSYRDVINMRKELSNLQENVKQFEKEVSRKLDEASLKSFDEYKNKVDTKGGVVVLTDFDKSKIRQLVDYLAALSDQSTVALINITDGKYQILIKNLNKDKDASSILKGVFMISEGRGGGKKDFAQGGTNSMTNLDEITTYLKTEIDK
ncbi:alanine--tRNA ligase [bacterium]|nr:alanine--tRNA ligase [bacterium]